MKLSSLYEDFHGGDASSGAQFPTNALERSESRKGTSDLYVHPSDKGQAGKSTKKKSRKSQK